jgi:hypothetical protein
LLLGGKFVGQHLVVGGRVDVVVDAVLHEVVGEVEASAKSMIK